MTENNEKEVAGKLLEIKAIKLAPNSPFTWASGWKSPIYCDNRKILSYPNTRKYIVEQFAKIISNIKDFDIIAGVATGAIAHGVLVAEILGKPFIYVRSENKAHGLGNKIEGSFTKGQNVLVIEDLISTGGSSLTAVKALREAGLTVDTMIAIFTYGFDVAKKNIENANCNLITLSNYNALTEKALEINYIDTSMVSKLQKWREAPEQWGK